MTELNRYPYIRNLVRDYTTQPDKDDIINLLENGISSEDEAFTFSRFVITMVNHMSRDVDTGIPLMCNPDITNTIPNIDYEVSTYLSNRGFEYVWDIVCDES